MKIVYSDRKTGRTAQADVPKDKETMLLGNAIGDIIDGSIIGLEAYKLQITGLTDKAGTPSRKDLEGTRKAYAYVLDKKAGKKGLRRRKLVRGKVIAQDTEQINTVIVQYGTKPVEELFKPKKEENSEK